MKILITGASSGLGYGMAVAAKFEGHQVFALCRRQPALELDGFVSADLGDLSSLPEKVERLLTMAGSIDLAVLNAGQLGEMEFLHRQSLDALKGLMDVNLWANKVISDALLDQKKNETLQQLVMISSGASRNGHAGWGGYSISKAGLNMMAKLYASEHPLTHVCALAPGLIDSDMQEYLCHTPDPARYPSIQRLREARGTEAMPSPQEAGTLVWNAIKKVSSEPTGSYLDVRQLKD